MYSSIFSPVRWGKNPKSCGRYPSRPQIRSGRSRIDSPSSSAVPELGSSRPARMRISVVLPAPLGPRRPNIPLGTSRSTPANAVTGPG